MSSVPYCQLFQQIAMKIKNYWKLYIKTDSLQEVLSVIATHFQIDANQAKERLSKLIERINQADNTTSVEYKFYPSEIVRAMQRAIC